MKCTKSRHETAERYIRVSEIDKWREVRTVARRVDCARNFGQREGRGSVERSESGCEARALRNDWRGLVQEGAVILWCWHADEKKFSGLM